MTPGTTIHVVMTKWGDRPHWEFDATYLGSDAHGDWLGIPAGTTMTRPGVDYVAPVAQVGLVPGAGSPVERGLAGDVPRRGRAGAGVRRHDHAAGVGPAPRVRAVDLDLDVIQDPDGRVWVDDEDEFAEHRVELGYPDEVVALATASRDRIRDLVARGAAPFDGLPGGGSPSCSVSPPDPRPPSRAAAAGGCGRAGRARGPARPAAVRRAGTRPVGPRA